MAPGSHSCRNAPPRSAGYSNRDAFGDFFEYPKPQANEKGPRTTRIILIPPAPLVSTIPRLQLHFFVIRSAFVGTNAHVKVKKWLLCLGLSSRLSFERVWVTQGFLYIPPRVVLDEIPKTSKRKFSIRRLTSNILNPSSLMLTELQKNLTSINSLSTSMY